MNRLDGFVIVLVAVALAVPGFVVGQTPPPAPTTQKTLAATMNVYVFPTKGQKPEQQSQDEAECYNYATQNTGTDPFALQKQSQEQAQQTEQAKQQAQQAGKGAGDQGAVKGAAPGAVVGSVSHGATSGEGAAAGILYKGRERGMNPYKAAFAEETPLRTLEQAVKGAHVLVGVSVEGAFNAQLLSEMAEKPIIFALANPEPEIGYPQAKQARPDAIVATGRSDYPNQVNNVLCFPFVSRCARCACHGNQ